MLESASNCQHWSRHCRRHRTRRWRGSIRRLSSGTATPSLREVFAVSFRTILVWEIYGFSIPRLCSWFEHWFVVRTIKVLDVCGRAGVRREVRRTDFLFPPIINRRHLLNQLKQSNTRATVPDYIHGSYTSGSDT